MDQEARALLKNARIAAATEAGDDWDPAAPIRHASYTGPGRLSNPRMELKDEPRVNAKLAVAMASVGLDRNKTLPRLVEVSETSSLEQIATLMEDAEVAVSGLYNGAIPIELSTDVHEPEVYHKEENIAGGDGQDMVVHVYRPSFQEADLPSVVYFHGGGMTITPTFNPLHDRWCRSIALQGCVVVMPDFRNAWTREGYHPFPAGLNDCIAAVKWVVANKGRLDVSSIILQGESGGANLSFAVALLANREGWISKITGVYGVAPYISNAYGWTLDRKLRELPSLVENDGYFLNAHMSTFMAYFYTPTDEHMNNPLAWPYHASLSDMEGFPPHVVVCDELDGLRDEGISYARRLVRAGVKCEASLNLGVVHASSLIFRSVLPENHRLAVAQIATFARQCTTYLSS